MLRRREDAHCVVFHLLCVAAYAAAFWLWLHPDVAGLHGLPERAVFVATAVPLLGWISGVDVGVNFHNHTHRRLFDVDWQNRWAARLWAVFAAWPGLLWQHAHVAVHHAHLLQPRDWTLPRLSPDGRFEPRHRYQLLHWPWRSTRQLWRDARNGRLDRWRAGRETLWFLVLWSMPFCIDPVMALWLWLLPHWFANCVTMGAGMFVQHAGCELPAARLARHHSNDFPSPFFNLTMFNIGFHSRHHEQPGVHWADLPASRSGGEAAAATVTELRA